MTPHRRDAKLAQENADLEGEMLYGTKAIAAFLGVRPRQALGMIERGALPHFHVGRIVCGRRSTLSAWLTEQEVKSTKPGA